ncbi:hypothetical protein Hanom_Chr04g00313721 [Helianthus anomalus]
MDHLQLHKPTPSLSISLPATTSADCRPTYRSRSPVNTPFSLVYCNTRTPPLP